jgi:hypothetical protein
VEFSLRGCRLGRHTISIPSKLLPLSRDSTIQNRLQTTFRLIQRDSQLSSEELDREKRRIEKIYLRSLGERFGVVILRQQKDSFLKEVKDLRCKVEAFAERVEAGLKKELEDCRQKLIITFLPAVVAKPPDDLRGRILTGYPSEDVAKKYLCDALDKVIPQADKLITEMRLDCDFKDVTYEMLNDASFIEALQKAYPYVEWSRPYDEREAIEEKR